MMRLRRCGRVRRSNYYLKNLRLRKCYSKKKLDHLTYWYVVHACVVCACCSYVCVHARICVCAYKCFVCCVYMSVHVCVQVFCVLCIYVCSCVCAYVCVCMRVCVRACECVYVRIQCHVMDDHAVMNIFYHTDCTRSSQFRP